MVASSSSSSSKGNSKNNKNNKSNKSKNTASQSSGINLTTTATNQSNNNTNAIPTFNPNDLNKLAPQSRELLSEILSALKTLNLPSTRENMEYLLATSKGQQFIIEGKLREGADLYMELYQNHPTSFATFSTLMYYGQNFDRPGFEPTERDMEFIKNIEKGKVPTHLSANREIPKLERGCAAFFRGYVYSKQGDRQGAAQKYMRTIEIIQSMTPEEGNQKVVHGDRGWERAQDIAEGFVANARLNLKRMTILAEPDEPLFDNDEVGLEPEEVKAVMALVDRAEELKGITCDWCKKERTTIEAAGTSNANGDDEDGAGPKPVKLKQCGKCKRNWYCSSECQKKAWSAGHKKSCRDPYDLKKDDVVVLKNLVSKPELNGSIVTIVKRSVPVNTDSDDQLGNAYDGDTRWTVRDLLGKQTPRSVKAANIRVVIPVEERNA
ncbi:hypothetical protein HDU76_012659 [Blyttiomyces sp. JEL0837]|nr:hypothetical protein HDU76_012659 [Blyttiomyces sp. JEL0837]